MPRVSVIIPTYNRAGVIREALESVLDQTFKDIEIIVIDDGSKDNTREILEGYKDRVRYLYQGNQGISAARNRAIREAKGELIAFLDSDDFWLPFKLEEQVQIFNQNPRVGLVHFKMPVVDEAGQYYGTKPDHDSGLTFNDLIDKGGDYPTSSVMVRKECIDQVGSFDESLPMMEDYELWLRIAQFYDIHEIKGKVLGIYRKHATNISKNKILAYQSQMQLWEKILGYYTQLPKESVKILRRRIQKDQYLLSKTQYDAGHYTDAFSNLLACLLKNPLAGTHFLYPSDGFLKKTVKLTKPYLFFVLCLFKRFFSSNRVTGVTKAGQANSHKKRILFYESSSGIGGSGNMLRMIVKNLNKDLFEPFVVISHQGPQNEKIKRLGIPVFFVPMNKWEKRKHVSKLASSYPVYLMDLLVKMAPAAIRMAGIIRKYKISLIHINTDMTSGMAGILAAKLAGVPCVCHARSTKKKTLRRERVFAQWVDHFVLINKDMFEFYKTFVSEDKLSLVADGIEMDEFKRETGKSDIRREFGLADQSPLVGLVGRLVEGKGHDDFVKSAKIVLEKTPETRFLIVGDDPQEGQPILNQLKNYIREYNMEQSIIFTGWRNDVASITAQLDIMVQASSTFPEGFGLTCIEAMTAGKPVIATRIPGPKDVVLDRKTGLLIDPGHPQQMAEAIIDLLEHPEKAKEMGKYGRERVAEYFDFRKNVRHLEEIYEGGIDIARNEPVFILNKILLTILKFALNNKRNRCLVLMNIGAIFLLATLLIFRSLWIVLLLIVGLILSGVIYKRKKSSMSRKQYACWRQELERTTFDVNRVPEYSYIYLKDFVNNEKIKKDIENVLEHNEECVLADIDQDGRCFPYFEPFINFENVDRTKFFPRIRYKVEIVVLRQFNNLIAVKKDFRQDRTGAVDEAYILKRLQACHTPKLIKYDSQRNIVYMTFIHGKNVKDELVRCGIAIKDVDLKRNWKSIAIEELLRARKVLESIMDIDEVFREVRRINSYGVMMEDIKCGNIIIEERTKKPFWIDFHGSDLRYNIKGLIPMAMFLKMLEDLNRIFFLPKEAPGHV